MVACSDQTRQSRVHQQRPVSQYRFLRSCCLGFTALATTCSRKAYSWFAGPSSDMQAVTYTSMQCQSALRDALSMAPRRMCMVNLSGMHEATTS